MPARRVRVEVDDGQGGRFTVVFEGRITRDKVLQLLDLVELMGGSSGAEPEHREVEGLTIFDKVRLAVERKLPVGWFGTEEAQDAYESCFGDIVGLSTISTYLSRLSIQGVLERGGSTARRKYRLIRVPMAQTVKP